MPHSESPPESENSPIPMANVDQEQQNAVAESTTAQVPEAQQPADEDVDMADSNAVLSAPTNGTTHTSKSKAESQAETPNNQETPVPEAAASAPSESKPATGVKLEELFDEMDSDDDEFPTTKAAKREPASSPDLLSSQR